MTDKPIVLPELSYKIMGALFTVHAELGPSLLEKYYQREEFWVYPGKCEAFIPGA